MAAGPRLEEQAETAGRDVRMALEESMVAVMGEVRVGKEEAGGS